MFVLHPTSLSKAAHLSLLRRRTLTHASSKEELVHGTDMTQPQLIIQQTFAAPATPLSLINLQLSRWSWIHGDPPTWKSQSSDASHNPTMRAWLKTGLIEIVMFSIITLQKCYSAKYFWSKYDSKCTIRLFDSSRAKICGEAGGETNKTWLYSTCHWVSWEVQIRKVADIERSIVAHPSKDAFDQGW